MSKKQVRQIDIHTKRIRGGITLRNPDAPENGNQALHVCQDEKKVMENRKALADQTLPLDHWVLPWQKHTDHIVPVTAADKSKGAFDKETSIMETDALYTTQPDVLIGVFTADCLGILIADDTTPLVAAVHSGWKGTAQNILYKTLTHLFEQGLAHPQSVRVYFSPSIQIESFEIGPEVREVLMEAGKKIGLDYSDMFFCGEKDRFYADNLGMNLAVLRLLGISREQVEPNFMDTKTNEDCFSYRRDGSSTGEHFTYGWIASDPSDNP